MKLASLIMVAAALALAPGVAGAKQVKKHHLTRTAQPEHIDENGHVNNTVWVRWMEDLATTHWMRDADPAHATAYAWVVTRHEIDLGAVRPRERRREAEVPLARRHLLPAPRDRTQQTHPPLRVVAEELGQARQQQSLGEVAVGAEDDEGTFRSHGLSQHVIVLQHEGCRRMPRE